VQRHQADCQPAVTGTNVMVSFWRISITRHEDSRTDRSSSLGGLRRSFVTVQAPYNRPEHASRSDVISLSG